MVRVQALQYNQISYRVVGSNANHSVLVTGDGLS